MLPEYVSANVLQPFIADDLRVKLSESITYKPKVGQIARGVRATILPDICDIWIKARESGALSESPAQIHPI